MIGVSPGPGGAKRALVQAETILNGFVGGKVVGSVSIGSFNGVAKVNASGVIVDLLPEVKAGLISALSALEK